MKIQELDIALDGDGKNILVADFPTKYTDIKDFRVTDKVWAAPEFMGMRLYDHIIVGRDSWFSFAKEGKLAVVFSEIPDYNDNR